MKKLILMKQKNRTFWLAAAFMAICMMMWTSLASAATSVYAEGAYDDTSLVLYVYADITDDAPLVSQCFKVTYDPSKLEFSEASKNEAVWYFGKGGPDYPYKDPENTGDAVVVIGGKLDTDAPQAGVSGDRVLLGTVTFNRLSSNAPDDPLAPEEYFGISLGVGKGGNFANFVDVNGNCQDNNSDLFAGITIRERGDANGDGDVTPGDMISVRNYFYNGVLPPCLPAADCNNDAPEESLTPNVTPADMICIRNKFYSAP